MHPILIQAIGLVAISFSLSIYQTDKRSTMLKLAMLAGVFYGIHFFFLGAATGAAMSLINIARNYSFYRFGAGKKKLPLLLLFIGLTIGATMLTWQGPVSLLAMGGSIAASFAYWHTKPKHIRRWALLAPPLWFTYSAISGSFPGMLIQTVALASNLVGEYRFDLRGHIRARAKMAHLA